MDDKELKCFISAAEHLSFSVTAERLYMTQSAVSKRIAALESRLGCHLFERQHNKLALSDQGKIFLPYAVSAVNKMAEGIEAVSHASRGIKNTLTIGLVNFYAMYILPDFLTMFRDMHPEINMALTHMHQFIIFNQLRNKQIDLYISASGHMKGDEFHVKHLLNQEYAIMVSKHHPLAQKLPVTIEEIAKYPGIAPPYYVTSRQVLDNYCNKKNLDPFIQHESDFMHSLIQMTKGGQGWCLIPSVITDPKLVTIYRARELFVPLELLYRKNKVITESMTLFIDELMNACNISEYTL